MGLQTGLDQSSVSQIRTGGQGLGLRGAEGLGRKVLGCQLLGMAWKHLAPSAPGSQRLKPGSNPVPGHRS